MNKILAISIFSGIVGLIFIAFIIVIISLIKHALEGDEISVITKIFKGQKVTIEDMNSYLKNSNPSKEDLNVLSGYFIGSLKIPTKSGSKVPDAAKPYLDFIAFFALSANSNAKMIADFNKDLKAKNPDYISEIDAIESKGLKARG